LPLFFWMRLDLFKSVSLISARNSLSLWQENRTSAFHLLILKNSANAMNNKKKNQSTSTDSKTKVQTCKRCHMHGDRGVLLADHKLFCKYQSCTCLKCYAFLKQKRYSADVMILRRAYKLNERKNIQEVSFSLSHRIW